MGRLVIVRHGESVANAKGRMQGQTCSGLSALGRAQAGAVARWLAEELTAPIELMVSDLERARQTARMIGDVLGCEVNATDERLRERSCGRWENRTYDDIAASDPELWSSWRAGDDVLAAVGGEGDEALTARATTVLRDLMGRAESGVDVVAVTHGGLCWFGVHALLGLPLGTLRRPQNAALAMLSPRDGRVRLDSWNARGHLVGVTLGP